MTGIGPRLKRERLRLKLSQSALGAIGGVETNAQGNYENGIRSPRADYMSRISDAGIDVTYVVTGFSLERSTPQIETHGNTHSERLNRVLGRLHGSLHEVTQNLYHVTRLVEAAPMTRLWTDHIWKPSRAMPKRSPLPLYASST